MLPMLRLLTAALLALAPIAAAHAAGSLEIVQFDFEGGGGTLFIAPDKQTLLVDSGWPAGRDNPPDAPATAVGPSNAQRIAAELAKRGIARIDYLLTTHYHDDHVGGMAELMGLVPVGTFVDRGEVGEVIPAGATDAQRARAPATLHAQYRSAITGKKRRIVKAGDRLRVGALTVDITNASAQVLRRPLREGGGRAANCTGTNTDGGTQARSADENARSIGFVVRYGSARVILLGDTTREVETRLVCPVDLIGPVDLMIATHHGNARSNAPVLYATIRPRVVVIPNGRTKGGDPATYDAIMAAPGLQGLWQVHEAVKTGAKNGPVEQIANLAGASDANHALLIAVEENGTVTVTNARTGVSRAYPKRP